MKQFYKNQSISYFSRWTRKAYAAFNSLNKVVAISGLSVALTAVALPGEVVAQEDTTQRVSSQFDLEEVEIVDSELLQIFEVPSRVICVVGRQELQSAPIETVQDVLNNLSQIDLRQRGNNDVQADVSIRGGTFDQVLVMLNGVNITSPQTGHHNLDLPISFDQIERIEILNGAGSQSYGANAYSGVINIITRNAYKNEVNLKLVAGDFGLYNLGASASIVGQKHSQFIAINRDASSGYMENTDFARTSLYYNGRYRLKKSFFEWQASAAQKEFGSQSFYTAKYPNQFEETQSALASLKYQSYGMLSTQTNVYWNLHSDRFELFRNNEKAPSWYKNHNYHLTTVMGGNSKVIYKSKFGKSTIGIDVRYEHIASNVLGIPTGDTIDALFNPGGFYTKEDARTNTALSLEQIFNLGRLSMIAALTVNANTAYGNLGLYPGLDFNYRFRRNWKINASFYKTMRLPTFTDLYYAGPTNIGNPELLPEEAMNLDVGASFHKGIVKASITSFNSLGKNNIDWARTSDTLKWQPMNVTQVETYGIDAQVKLYLGKLKSNTFFIKNISLQYTFINKGALENDYESRYVMDYLRHKLVLGIHHRVYKNISASWKIRYQKRNGDYMHWDADAKQDILTPYGAYTLVDARIYWKLKGWTIFADVKNIFNIQYIDYGNVYQPGRWFSVGVKKSFNFKKPASVYLEKAI
ncbi:MAG: TonB-dependent receptor [Bacteroidales bacterium]|nr:TonB-dependent receptor [Bacteroidales bacterium]